MLSAQARNTAKRSVAAAQRSFSTAQGKTQYTSLTNGVTVATEANPAAKSSTLGLYFGAGSTSENAYNNGVSSLLNKVIVNQNTKEAVQSGFKFGAQTSRDYAAYYTQGLKSSLPKALEFLNAKVLSPDYTDATVLAERATAVKQLEAFEETQHAERVLEHLHATAFQNTPLALPTRGTVETLGDLVSYDLNSFHKKNYVSKNTVVVATGDVNHEEIVELVEKSLKVQSGEVPEIKQAKFLGSEIRLRDDTLPAAWISIAHQGEALNSPNYYVAKVAAEVFGSYNYSEPISKHQGVKLNDIVNENHLADTYQQFSLSYKDAGLFGFNAKISNIYQIDDFVHFALKEWNRLSISITETEVTRAKQLLKSKILFDQSTSLAIANDIGSKVIGQGRRATIDEIFSNIDQINASTVKSWASSQLWDQDIAIAGTGQIEDLLDYARIRADTSMMRW